MRTRFNPKRKLVRSLPQDERARLIAAVGYGGNPEHKADPGDFGLVPPAAPRPDKTLCDAIRVHGRDEALALLRRGIERGLVSERRSGAFPQNIWSVTEQGAPIEAELENALTGVYHGYPLPETDPFREVVLQAWREAEP